MATLPEISEYPFLALTAAAIIVSVVSVHYTIQFIRGLNKYDFLSDEIIITCLMAGLFAVLTSVSVILLTNLFISQSPSEIVKNIIDSQFHLIFLVPLLEESSKAIFTLLVFGLHREEIDTPLDGFTAGAMVGVSFALIENVSYGVASVFVSGNQGLFVVLIRNTIMILMHPFYTGLFGLGLFYVRTKLQKTPLKQFIQGLFLHSSWNFAALNYSTFNFQGVFQYFAIVGFVLLMFILMFTITITKIMSVEDLLHSKGYYQNPKPYSLKKVHR